jgi:hypothetical protein
MSTPQAGMLGLRRPGRFGHGAYMTVALIDQSQWMKVNDSGLLDLDATFKALEEAEKIIDTVCTEAPVPSQ